MTAETETVVVNEATQAQEAKPVVEKKIIATKISGQVKWFNVKNGYGFINRSDTHEDIFVHQSAIIKNNPQKYKKSVGEGESVEFDIVQGEKGNEAANVTGPNGEPVVGSKYAADRNANRRSNRGRRFFNARGRYQHDGRNDSQNAGGEGDAKVAPPQDVDQQQPQQQRQVRHRRNGDYVQRQRTRSDDQHQIDQNQNQQQQQQQQQHPDDLGQQRPRGRGGFVGGRGGRGRGGFGGGFQQGGYQQGGFGGGRGGRGRGSYSGNDGGRPMRIFRRGPPGMDNPDEQQQQQQSGLPDDMRMRRPGGYRGGYRGNNNGGGNGGEMREMRQDGGDDMGGFRGRGRGRGGRGNGNGNGRGRGGFSRGRGPRNMRPRSDNLENREVQGGENTNDGQSGNENNNDANTSSV